MRRSVLPHFVSSNEIGYPLESHKVDDAGKRRGLAFGAGRVVPGEHVVALLGGSIHTR